MENIKEMNRRHQKEIEVLQLMCKHPSISNWMNYSWAPGHYSGQVKICNFCGKTMERANTYQF